MSLKNVTREMVTEFVQGDINSRLGSHGVGVSNSYMQDSRHDMVSPKYQPIQAASVGNALAESGFKMVSVLTGKGRQQDKLDFQRTIARYRCSDQFAIEGLNLDIIYVSKHLGRGCDELRLGLYRGVCANQWTAGTLFDMVRIRHSSNALDDIQTGIQEVLTQREKLVATIQRMQSTMLNAEQIAQLAEKFASIRLEGKENVIKADFRVLGNVRRQDDAFTDLFTVANVLQENVIRFPMAYDINATDAQGNPYVRHMNTRRLRESSSQLVDLNAKLFDAALEFAA